MADFLTKGNVAVAGAVNGSRDLITAPNLHRWVMEGKVFTASTGYENAGIDGESDTKADTACTAALISPSSQDVLVVPLLIKAFTHTEGGAVELRSVAITKPAAECATNLVISGTAMPIIRNNNVLKSASPAAYAKYTCTASALTESDYFLIDKQWASDNIISAGTGAVYRAGTAYELDLRYTPYILCAGAALMFWSNTATTDTKVQPYLVWAELEEEDLY